MVSRRRLALGVTLLALCLTVSVSKAQPGAEGFDVTFLVNDAAIKDQVLAGVGVVVSSIVDSSPGEDSEPADATLAEGRTDAAGRLGLRLAPGLYQVSFYLAGHVPVDTEVTIHSANQLITTSLSRMLEAAPGPLTPGSPAQRLRIILNWGSSENDQVKDVDSHLQCACGIDEPHVYYSQKEHQGLEHRVELDVDDIDWGGPETITVLDPIPGRYLYWVHDYSSGPGNLSYSDVVVRVLADDTLLAERRLPPGPSSRHWRPFAAIEIGSSIDNSVEDGAAVEDGDSGSVGDASPRVIAFTDAEIEQGLDFDPPPGFESNSGFGSLASGCALALAAAPILVGGVLVLLVVIVVSRRAKR